MYRSGRRSRAHVAGGGQVLPFGGQAVGIHGMRILPTSRSIRRFIFSAKASTLPALSRASAFGDIVRVAEQGGEKLLAKVSTVPAYQIQLGGGCLRVGVRDLDRMG